MLLFFLDISCIWILSVGVKRMFAACCNNRFVWTFRFGPVWVTVSCRSGTSVHPHRRLATKRVIFHTPIHFVKIARHARFVSRSCCGWCGVLDLKLTVSHIGPNRNLQILAISQTLEWYWILILDYLISKGGCFFYGTRRWGLPGYKRQQLRAHDRCPF